MSLVILSCLLPFLFIYPPSKVVNLFHETDNYDYVILNKNKPFTEQFKNVHTIYEIKDDIDLQGKTVYIPSDCILKFSGGSLNNGDIVFDNTIIESQYKNIFRKTTVSGIISNREVWLSWWQLFYDKNHNDAILINQVINSIDNCILYYDIQQDVYVGTDKRDGSAEETIAFLGKQSLKVIQPTEYYTILRGRSSTGSVVRCNFNINLSVDGLKIDGGNVYYSKYGENGIGVVGNKKVVIENCLIRNCYSNCFDKAANGTILENNGYPEWGSGGKGIQIEGGTVGTLAVIRNNIISNCYIGISNNASHQENVIMDGNFIDSCYMSLILLRLNERIEMSVNIDNTIIANNTGDVGVICMGNPNNVSISNTQIKGENKTKAILRGCYSYSNIQLIVNQPCESLLDVALYRDNPEGHLAQHNYVCIISDQPCDNIITTSEIVPKRGGSIYAKFEGSEFDITLPGKVIKTPIDFPNLDRTSVFNIKYRTKTHNGDMETIDKKE